MNTRNLLMAGGAAALSLVLIALPATSAKPQSPDDSSLERLQQKMEGLQAELAARLASHQDQLAKLAETRAMLATQAALAQEDQAVQELEELPEVYAGDLDVLIGDEGSSWLGVETHEVTAEKAKDLKLPAERGVLFGRVVPDSPAAKAGLKENDVVTEINGQRVEGAAQFRRMIHEIPAGRTVQLTVWREGRSQTLSVTLGKAEENHRALVRRAPGAFAFHMPEIPSWDLDIEPRVFLGGQPRLGIDAEDLSGQLGAFFGAPDGEGILVREVNPGSPAEKAGVKAGDVITSFNGARIRTVGELREKLSAKRDEKNKTVKLGILRNKSEISLTVELPESPARTKHTVSHRTNI